MNISGFFVDFSIYNQVFTKIKYFLYSVVTYKDNQKNVAINGNEVFQPLNVTIFSDVYYYKNKWILKESYENPVMSICIYKRNFL